MAHTVYLRVSLGLRSEPTYFLAVYTDSGACLSGPPVGYAGCACVPPQFLLPLRGTQYSLLAPQHPDSESLLASKGLIRCISVFWLSFLTCKPLQKDPDFVESALLV